MSDDLIAKYNYDVFASQNFEQWMRWDSSPKIGSDAPDFPLWTLDEQETRLSALWKQHNYLIVEFGSFT
ncbi:MAG: hypothetical protein L0154_09880 [Chloroflexi bacterium]|nr:hypothetical protein [Chloroflexota bacterium]